MLLTFLIAVGFLAVATYLVADAASMPARQQELALRRAVRYGRRRLGNRSIERLKFHERVVVPAVNRLARITLRLSPKATVDGIGSRLLAAGLAPRLSPTQFLAVKSGLGLGLLFFALVFGLSTSPVGAIILTPV